MTMENGERGPGVDDRVPVAEWPGPWAVQRGTWWRDSREGTVRKITDVHAHGVYLACNDCGGGELFRWSQFNGIWEPSVEPPAIPSSWRDSTGKIWVVEAMAGLGPILSGGPGMFELQCVPITKWPGEWKPVSEPLARMGDIRPSSEESRSRSYEDGPHPLERILRQRIKEQTELWRGLKAVALDEQDPVKSARTMLQAIEAEQYGRAFMEILEDWCPGASAGRAEGSPPKGGPAWP